MRRRDDDYEARVEKEGRRAVVSIDAIDKAGRFRNELRPELRVIGPDQRVSTRPMEQVGPGAYRAQIPLTSGDYVFRISDDRSGGASRSA